MKMLEIGVLGSTNGSDLPAIIKSIDEGELKGILGYCEDPLVSIDFNGSSLSSIVDAPSTMVIEDMVKVKVGA